MRTIALYYIWLKLHVLMLFLVWYRIKREFKHKCCLISFDSFYKGLSPEDHDNAANYNFDSPNALDFDLAFEKIKELL